MVRQNVEGLLHEAFRIIDTKSFADKGVVEIKPELVFMESNSDATADVGGEADRRPATAKRPRL